MIDTNISLLSKKLSRQTSALCFASFMWSVCRGECFESSALNVKTRPM